jgi:hypothetical protein
VADQQLKQRSIAEKILQDRWPKHEADNDGARDISEEALTRGRESLMLDVRLANGTVESFPYAYLTRLKYVPGDTLTLRFGADEVTAEGRNLGRWRDAISQHRARFIQEGTEAEEGLKPEDAAHIGRIVITEREDA